MKEKMKEEKISDALLKVALGYQVAEVTEEYAEVDGELKLTKRKKTKKDIPPDLKAVQLLLSTENEGNYADWTEEQLLAEKQRLLEELTEKQGDAEEAKSQGVEKSVSVKKTVLKKAAESKKTAGSVELKAKKPRPKPRKRVVRKAVATAMGKHLKE